MTLEEVPSGARVFIDAPIFIYHFTAASESCRNFLERCEAGDLKAVTSTVVLAEVGHRLMMAEAVARELVTPGNVVKKLRRKPDVVKQLRVSQGVIEKVPLMSIEVASLGLKTLLGSAELRREHGLLMNDSLVATAALEQGADGIASADRDFARLSKPELFLPSDV